MKFTLETTDMDLGDTAIENIFINDFMPMGNGTSVKVYLLGFKYAKDKDKSIEVTNQVIARHLEISLEDVMDAWDFWEDKGIVEKIHFGSKAYEYGIEFKSLKQLYIKNNFTILNKIEEESKISNNDLITISQNPMINQMFSNINHLIRMPLVPEQKREILSWMTDYNMNPDVIEFAFRYAVENKEIKQPMNYVRGTIRGWYSEKLTNIEAVKAQVDLNNKRYGSYRKILRHIGLGGELTEHRKEIMKSWFDDYGFSEEVILEACKKGSLITNPNLNYVDGILKNWYDDQVRTMDDLREIERIKTGDKVLVDGELCRDIMKSIGVTGEVTPHIGELVNKWFNEYKYSKDLVYEACKIVTKWANPSIDGLDRILTSWYEGRTEVLKDPGEKPFGEKAKLNKLYSGVKKELGLSGSITPSIEDILRKWLYNYNYSEDFIIYASKEFSKNMVGPTINKLDRKLEQIYNEGIKTLEELKANIDSKERVYRSNSNNSRPNSYKASNDKNYFNEFSQRTDNYTEDELEDVARKKREEAFARLRGE